MSDSWKSLHMQRELGGKIIRPVSRREKKEGEREADRERGGGQR